MQQTLTRIIYFIFSYSWMDIAGSSKFVVIVDILVWVLSIFLQLFRLCLPDIFRSKIGFSKKANLIFLFFLLRKLILPFYSFTLFCIILPMTMFLPEAHLPAWVVCYVPAIMSFLNILPAPRSFPFIVPYLLFENTMSVTKFNAMISGLFQLGSAYEWVVTKKIGPVFRSRFSCIGWKRIIS